MRQRSGTAVVLVGASNWRRCGSTRHSLSTRNWRRTFSRGRAWPGGNGSSPKLRGGGVPGGSISLSREFSRGNSVPGSNGGGVKSGGAVGSLNNGVGGLVADLKLAPGSGLNCGCVSELVTITTLCTQRKSVGGGSGS